jgi:RNA polymerase sigma-70 factor (ECF subfamily)
MDLVPIGIPQQPGEAAELAGLLTAACCGNEAAWRQVVERYGRRVYALAKSRCKRAELAEEVTQSVFATVAAKLAGGGYVEQGRFESWLFRVAMNRVRDEMRRRARQATPTDPAAMAGLTGGSGAARADTGAEIALLREAMDQLNDEDREVIELRHHGGMSFKQMAETLDEPLGTLLARHHRALHKLRKIMTREQVAADAETDS